MIFKGAPLITALHARRGSIGARHHLRCSGGKRCNSQVLPGYTGETSFVNNANLVFAVCRGGAANDNLVGLTSTTKLP